MVYLGEKLFEESGRVTITINHTLAINLLSNIAHIIDTTTVKIMPTNVSTTPIMEERLYETHIAMYIVVLVCAFCQPVVTSNHPYIFFDSTKKCIFVYGIFQVTSKNCYKYMVVPTYLQFIHVHVHHPSTCISKQCPTASMLPLSLPHKKEHTCKLNAQNKAQKDHPQIIFW